METSWSVPGYERAAIKIVVEGEGGTLSVDDGAIRLDLRRPAGGFPAGESRVPVAEIPDPAGFELGGPGFWAEDAGFVACLAGSSQLAVTWHDALAVQRIVDAVYRSAGGEGRIALDG